jgi:hypothetical protein
MPEYRARFIYTEPLARSAYLAFLWDQHAVFIAVSPLLLVASIAFWRSAEYAFVGGMFFGGVVIYWAALFRGLRQAGRIAVAYGSPEVEWILTDEELTIRSPHVESSTRWSKQISLHRLRRFWLFLRPGIPGFMFAPVDALSPELRVFLEKRVRQAGGRVR